MAKSRLETQTASKMEITKVERTEAANSLENNIECPRCHDDMTLCFEFDNLYYVCEECDFRLFTLKER
jgi:hypothetical protein